ncbi:folylpolyglutamate synthetase [Coprinopsis sp. MPI-PUGE-AT-0042]|nr:folylpolyglutamate synthetase [Coprinopsis sp. MPI-PUGE-AT-0042]
MSIDLSLDRLNTFFPLLPVTYKRPSIHIAGTNGKGSISAILTSIFLAVSPPLRVGRYNSPHLTKVTDCITIDDQPVDDEIYLSTRSEVEALTRRSGIDLSPFEVLTVTALQIFEKLEVDLAVIEVGMGGRLDATNIIPDDAILVSALSTVDLDHQNFLGPTMEDIAREKAGIARPGKPFVFGHQQYSQVWPVVKEVLDARGGVVKYPVPVIKRRRLESASLRRNNYQLPQPQLVQFVLPSIGPEPIDTSFTLGGDHQITNLSTALGVIESLSSFKSFSSAAIRDGIANVQWRGRLSWHTPNLGDLLHPILVDGAHNPGSSEALSKYINRTVAGLPSPSEVHLHLILGMSSSPSKPPRETLLPLVGNLPQQVTKIDVSLVEFSLPEGMPWVKPVASKDLERTVKELLPHADAWAGSSEAGSDTDLQAALRRVGGAIAEGDEKTHHFVVLAGSLYLVADFYRLLDVGKL